jgi:hypothetical protein
MHQEENQVITIKKYARCIISRVSRNWCQAAQRDEVVQDIHLRSQTAPATGDSPPWRRPARACDKTLLPALPLTARCGHDKTVGWKSCYSHGGGSSISMYCKTSNRNDRSTESNALAMSTSSRIANRAIILQPAGNIVLTKKHPPSEHRLEGRKPCDPTTQVRWEQLWRHSWSPANLRKQDNGESRGVKKSIKTWRRPDDKHLATVQSEVLCNSGSNGKTLLCVMPG